MADQNSPKTDHSLDCRWDDLGTALSLLSRIPVPASWINPERLSASAWAYPLAGGVIGALAGLVLMCLIFLGFSAGLATVLALGCLIFLTGGLHEDGLADCADGLGGAADKDRALQIMKDSSIGTYGAVALILFLIGRWSALADLAVTAPLASMIVVGAISRMPMVLVMCGMSHARADGLSRHVGRPSPLQAAIALSITALIIFITTGLWGFVLLPLLLVSALPVVFFASRTIGGQTGDVLGAIQQCAELAALAFLVAIWT